MPSKKRREIFARNLQRYIDMSGKSSGSFCESIGITAASLSEWLNAKKYPRIDTIEDFLEILVKKITPKVTSRTSRERCPQY